MKPSAAEARLRQHRGKAHRVPRLQSHGGRGRARRSRCHARPCAGAAERRAEGRPRHARVGHAADPEEAGEGRRARHAAHLGRAHVRHQLRRLHPARGAGEFRRRAAGVRPDRRRDRGGRGASACCTCTSPTRSWPAAAPRGWRRRRATSAATAACSRSTSARPTRAATSISWSTARACRSRRSIEAASSEWVCRGGATGRPRKIRLGSQSCPAPLPH